MPLVEIIDVVICRPDANLAGCSIDLPLPNTQSDIYEIDVAGWALGPDGPPEAIDLIHRGELVRTVALDHPREGVAEALPHVANALQSGFHTRCGVNRLDSEFEIEVTAVFPGEDRVRIGTIRGRHEPAHSNFHPALQPLMLTSLGRTGTTWLMQMLSQHPAIVGHTLYPNEVKCGSYWIHMFTVLADPANLLQSAHPDNFDANPFWVGQHPFHSLAVTGPESSLRDWFGRQYVEDLAGFCQQSIERFYLELAKVQGRTNPMYFVEKHKPLQLPRTIWQLYRKAREIFLVRDLRDMLCSIFAFNARRGFSGFGRKEVADDEAYVRQLRIDAECLLTNWTERSSRAHLVRYEDLILRPEPTLKDLFAYLDVDNDLATIRRIIEHGSIETVHSRQHRTIPDPKSSIGRWRRELNPQLRKLCNDTFSDLLRDFGYSETATTAA
jgi:sulfotransferase family protein